MQSAYSLAPADWAAKGEQTIKSNQQNKQEWNIYIYIYIYNSVHFFFFFCSLIT